MSTTKYNRIDDHERLEWLMTHRHMLLIQWTEKYAMYGLLLIWKMKHDQLKVIHKSVTMTQEKLLMQQ